MNDDVERWLSLQPPTTRKGLTVVEAATAGDMFHISVDGGIKKFVPFVTRRAADIENTSIPRVSVSPSLMGCFVGYAKGWSDIAWPDLKSKKFKNGWYIYKLPYEYAIKPSVKELYDQKLSDEHWLVTYSPTTVAYKPEVVGKVFVSELTMVPRAGQYPKLYQRTLVEVLSGFVTLVDGILLTTGHWEIYGPNFESYGEAVDVTAYTVKKLGFAEYAKAKQFTADMLSLPPSFNW